jgi:hypothetical protein
METWAIDGVPLLDLATDVQRIDPNLAPPLRGEDRQYAFRPGRAFRPRVTDSRTITLGLWLIGQDGPGTTAADYMNNYAEAERTLIRLLRPDYGVEFEITRTWTDDLGTHTATGHGVAAEAPQRARAGKHAGRVTVDIAMADPFFYGSAMAVDLAVGVSEVVTNPGDAMTTAAVIDFTGQLSNPTLTNSTLVPEVWLKVGSDVGAGDGVTADVTATSAVRDSDGANLIGAITHSGARAWFALGRGANTVTLSADGGAGTATLTYQPVYY